MRVWTRYKWIMRLRLQLNYVRYGSFVASHVVLFRSLLEPYVEVFTCEL